MFEYKKRDVINECLREGVGCLIYHRKPNVVSAVMVVTKFTAGRFTLEGDKLSGDGLVYEGTESHSASKPIPLHQIEQIWMAHPSGR